ncbi:MAG: hypothetical protein R3224_08760 [Balneolaceae bacterium]|nr:hypothetical protein [Balneolaceae bacterium]
MNLLIKGAARIVLLMAAALVSGSIGMVGAQDLDIRQAEIGYPVPAVPFYHFKVNVDLPHPSIIQVEAAVDGEVLRFTNLYRSAEFDQWSMDKPRLSHRPPSGYSLSHDNTIYRTPYVIGWLRWDPGREYTIRISVRMKEQARPSENDVILTDSVQVRAPVGGPVFDPSWNRYKALVVSETAGIDRKGTPVEALLPFYPDEAGNIGNDLRVVAVDPETHELDEVPSQVYDIREYLEEDDLAPDEAGKPTRDSPLWLPTVTARLAFLADLPARTSRVYLIFYDNEDARKKNYPTDLRFEGEAPGYRIGNSRFTADLHPNSGVLDRITLRSHPDDSLYHEMETNGAIHWNPGVYVPPRAWSHTSDWKSPHLRSISGPVTAITESWGKLRGVPEVDASVRYRFFAGSPYFIGSTSMRINETIQTLAVRNGEIVFRRELMTHAAWYDVVRDSIMVFNTNDMADLTDLKMEADVPWITFYNSDTGIGFAGIQLNYSNAGLESRPRLLNPYFYITGGPWIYWARALSLSFLSSNMQQVIPATKGSFFAERWAYLVYEIEEGFDPYAPVLRWRKKLIHPPRIRLVEKVDERVSKSVNEIFMDDGKSGWEKRETGKH